MRTLIGFLSVICWFHSAAASPHPEKVPAHLKGAVDHADRPQAERDRDPRRKPAEVLTFFGIKPGHRVADIMAGGGYYTEILARAVGPKGQVIAQNNPFVVERFVKKRLHERVEKGKWDHVEVQVTDLDALTLPKNLDAAVMILFYHDTYWQKVDRAEMNRQIFTSLKPGGVFGIVDHSAKAGVGEGDVQTNHRIEKSLVVKELLAAGFELEGESPILANAEDTRDFPFFKDPKNTRDRTDRFILKFRKPR